MKSSSFRPRIKTTLESMKLLSMPATNIPPYHIVIVGAIPCAALTVTLLTQTPMNLNMSSSECSSRT